MVFGEPGGTRTRDPLIKSQMLYQLSYRPICVALPEKHSRAVVTFYQSCLKERPQKKLKADRKPYKMFIPDSFNIQRISQRAIKADTT